MIRKRHGRKFGANSLHGGNRSFKHLKITGTEVTGLEPAHEVKDVRRIAIDREADLQSRDAVQPLLKCIEDRYKRWHKTVLVLGQNLA